MDWGIIIIGFLGGAIAGGMNTLAGFGSIITLSILMELMGLPGNMANGTNRMTILFASMIGTFTFWKNDKLNLEKGKWFFIFMMIGALLGIYLALIVSNEQFKIVFKILIVFLFFILLFNPKKLLREVSDTEHASLWIVAPVFFILGIYGGFIQMGTGVFYVVSIVLLGRFNLVEGNALKLFTVSVYTVIALFIFWWNGLVNWNAGLSITLGQILGTYLTARFASSHKNANVWAYRVLLTIVVFVIAYYFGVFNFFVTMIR